MWWNSRRGPDLRSWYVSWSINRVLFLVTNKCLMLQFRYCLSWFVIISVAAVAACISCSGFLPPTLFGSSKTGHCFSPRCAIYWTWSCWWACWWFWTWALWPRVTPMRMPRWWLQLGANGRRESVRPKNEFCLGTPNANASSYVMLCIWYCHILSLSSGHIQGGVGAFSNIPVFEVCNKSNCCHWGCLLWLINRTVPCIEAICVCTCVKSPWTKHHRDVRLKLLAIFGHCSNAVWPEDDDSDSYRLHPVLMTKSLHTLTMITIFSLELEIAIWSVETIQPYLFGSSGMFRNWLTRSMYTYASLQEMGFSVGCPTTKPRWKITCVVYMCTWLTSCI